MPAVLTRPDARVEDRAIRAYNAAYDVAGRRGFDAVDRELAARAAETFVLEGADAAHDLWSSSWKIPSGCDFCCGGKTAADAKRESAHARTVVAFGVDIARRLAARRG